MNLSHFLAVIRARWIPALVVFVIVVASAIFYVSTATRIYTATASLLIDSKTDAVTAMLTGGATAPAVINTQMEIIRSDRVAQRVVQNLKLADTADLKAAWERGGKSGGTLAEWLGNFVQAGLEVKVASPGSTVVNITYRSADPRFAATVANAYVQAFLETSIELRVDPARQNSGFFNEQQKAARDLLEAAQNKLSSFQKEKQIIGSDDRFDLELARLNTLTQNLVSIQQARVEATARLGAAGNASQMSEVLGSGTVSGLKSQLASAELKLQELSSHFGDKNPQVQDARAAVAEIKTKLAHATSDVTGAVGIDARISRQREAELQAAIDTQRNKVLDLKQTRDQATVLQRDVDNAQRAYDQVFSRVNQTSLESQYRQSNATVISQATVPAEPSSPKVASNLFLGVAGALVLGIGFAILIEQFDKRLRTTADAIDFLGLPVIGIMPSPSMNRRLRGQMALIQERVISGRRLAGPEKGQA